MRFISPETPKNSSLSPIFVVNSVDAFMPVAVDSFNCSSSKREIKMICHLLCLVYRFYQSIHKTNPKL